MAEALSLVERGWRGARQCSLALYAQRMAVTHLVKGCLSREIRGMIASHPFIRVRAVPRWIFPALAYGMLIGATVRGRLRWVLIDHPRTLARLEWWCRQTGVVAVLVNELDEGYELRAGGQPQAFSEVFGFQPKEAGGVKAP